jgi:cytochrome bd ubiquinol oxidase subunit I
MSVVHLVRTQFAVTASIHFLFVALSLGLVVFVAAMQTAHVSTGRDDYLRMTKFWGRLYVVNYGMGVISGIVMEFQFGLNWTGLTSVVGNVFGGPLALETLIAFVGEATFLGIWIFGWGRLPRGLHLASIWLVALTAYASALWIIAANAFLQHPVGYAREGGVVRLSRFSALLSNPSLGNTLLHVISAVLLTGALFVAGVSAWHLIRRTPERWIFTVSLRFGLLVAPVAAYLIIHFGFEQEIVLEQHQPMKLATLYQDPAKIAALQQQLTERFGPGDYRPPGWISIAYQVMMNSGFGLALLTTVCALLLIRNAVIRLRFPLYLLVAALPVPFLLVISGWLVREVGRQPWAVYGLLTTDDAAAHLSTASALASLIGFAAVLATLAAIDYWLIARYARRGVEENVFGPPATPESRDDAPTLVH